MKNKILLISAQSVFGGGPKSLDILISNLNERFDFYICAPSGTSYANEWVKTVGVGKFFEIPHRKFSIFKFFNLLSFIAQNDIHIVHAHGRGAALYAGLLSILNLKIRVIYSLHGFHFENWSFFKRKFFKMYEIFFNLRRYKIICVSPSERDSYERFIGHKESKISIVYNGIDLNQNILIKHRSHDSCFRVITLARFDPIKNLQEIVQIASKLLKYEYIKFEIYGDGNDFELIKLLIQNMNLKNVKLCGYTDRPLGVLDNGDLLLSSSFKEGLPYTFLEAMALGKPIIASKVPGHIDCVIDEHNGFLYELGSIDKAASFILEMYNDTHKYELFSLASRELFEKYFTLHNHLEAISKTYSLSE